MEKRFYVYTLSDPRDASIFYVGKGSRGRAWQHESDVRNGRPITNRRKHDRISEILSAGHRPEVSIVFECEDEADAYEYEVDLIAASTGLTNMLTGGIGGWALTKEEFARRAAFRNERMARKKQIRTRKWLADWLATAEAWGELTIPGVSNGDELAREYIDLVKKIVASPMPEPIQN